MQSSTVTHRGHQALAVPMGSRTTDQLAEQTADGTVGAGVLGCKTGQARKQGSVLRTTQSPQTGPVRVGLSEPAVPAV